MLIDELMLAILSFSENHVPTKSPCARSPRGSVDRARLAGAGIAGATGTWLETTVASTAGQNGCFFGNSSASPDGHISMD